MTADTTLANTLFDRLYVDEWQSLKAIVEAYTPFSTAFTALGVTSLPSDRAGWATLVAGNFDWFRKNIFFKDTPI